MAATGARAKGQGRGSGKGGAEPGDGVAAALKRLAGKRGARTSPEVQDLVVEATRGLSGFGAPDIAITAWSIAKLKVQNATLLNAISSAVIAQQQAFVPNELSKIAWAVAKLEGDDRPLLQALSTSVMQKLPEFTCPELASTVWAVAKLR